MTDRPILFSAPMIQALLDGRKTQTRRVLKNPEYYGCPTGDCPHMQQAECDAAMQENALPDVRFKPGDRLWVREEYYQVGQWSQDAGDLTKGGKPKWKFVPLNDDITFDPPRYFLLARSRTNPDDTLWYKRLGRFMPRRYSRLTLLVTDVRVQRLQDISEADAVAEGIARRSTIYDRQYFRNYASAVGWFAEEHDGAKFSFATLWNSINGPDAWALNPWVAAISFEVVKGNIDQVQP